jgi:hypothetical protein
MSVRHYGKPDHIELIGLVILLVLLITFLVDLAGWFNLGRLLLQ